MNIVEGSVEDIERRRKKAVSLLRLWPNPDFQLWLEVDVYSRVQWYKDRAMGRDLTTEQGRRAAEHDLVSAKTVEQFSTMIQTLAKQTTQNDQQFEKRSNEVT